jgi:SOS response regulatory protein OraA/RecX
MRPLAPAPRVEALEPLDRRGTRVRVAFDVPTEGEPLELALEVLERAGVGPGDPIDDALRARLGDADLRWRAREAALAFLAHRPRSRDETRRRLRAKAFPHAVVEDCLDELVGEGLIDDAAFADALVRERLRRNPRGPARLRDELRRRGLAPDAAAAAVARGLDDAGATDTALATETALAWLARRTRERSALAETDAGGGAFGGARRMGGGSPRIAAIRRLTTFLRGRGFGAEAVRAAVAAAEAAARAAPE